jgi:hypothetical protein
MPVVINEFEVVGESAAAGAAAPSANAGEGPKPKVEPAQIEQPLARLHELALRVWVH